MIPVHTVHALASPRPRRGPGVVYVLYVYPISLAVHPPERFFAYPCPLHTSSRQPDEE